MTEVGAFEKAVEAAARKLAGQFMVDDGYSETSRASAEAGEMWRNFAVGARAALTAALPLITGREWQDISTAPKDGTEIDLLYRYTRGRTINCRWTDDLKIGWHWKEPRWEKGKLLPESEWHTGTYPNMQPTHWMPVPASPLIADHRTTK